MTARTVAAVAAALGLGCAGRQAVPPSPPPPGVPDAALGLSRTSVFEVPAPPRVKDNESAPGESPALPRAHPLAPPRVPHAVADFLPITRASNVCADCHGVAKKEPGGPTPMPASHYTDLRNAPAKPGEKPAGARWVCTACHVQTTDARPLVGELPR